MSPRVSLWVCACTWRMLYDSCEYYEKYETKPQLLIVIFSVFEALLLCFSHKYELHRLRCSCCICRIFFNTHIHCHLSPPLYFTHMQLPQAGDRERGKLMAVVLKCRTMLDQAKARSALWLSGSLGHQWLGPSKIEALWCCQRDCRVWIQPVSSLLTQPDK